MWALRGLAAAVLVVGIVLAVTLSRGGGGRESAWVSLRRRAQIALERRWRVGNATVTADLMHIAHSSVHNL